MSGSRKILKNLFTISGATLASKGLAIFYSVYLIKILGPASNGAMGFSKSFVQYFLLFVLLGYDQVGVIEVAKDKQNHQKYMSGIFVVRMLSAILFYGLMVLLMLYYKWQFNLSDLKANLILLHGLNIFATALSVQWIFQAYERMGVIAVRTIILNVLIFTGLIFFVKNENDTVLAITVMSLANLINSIWLLIYYNKEYGRIKLEWDNTLIKSIVRSSYIIGFIWLIMTIYQFFNILILGTIKTDVETGLYNAAYQIITLAVLPNQILMDSFFPRLSQKDNNEDRIKIMDKFAILNHMVAVILSMSFLFYSNFLVKIIGGKYSQSGQILQYFSLVILFIYASVVYFPALLAWKKQNKLIFAHLSGAIVCVIVSILLVPKMGVYGSVISLTATEFVVAIIILYIYKKETNVTHLMNYLKIIILGIISFGSINFLKQINVNEILCFVLSLVIFVIMIFITKIITFDDIKRTISK